MMMDINSVNLFPTSTVIHFRPQNNICPRCHETLKVLKTHPGKKAATLAIGNFRGHETVYYCQGCGHVFHSNELRTLIPENCNFGYDIIVFIGKSLFLQSHNYQEIRLALQKRNVWISIREVFNNVPAFICHFHFLKAIGKNLFGDENDIIRKSSCVKSIKKGYADNPVGK